MRSLLSLTPLVAVFSFTPGRASTLRVPGEYGTIQTAMDASRPRDDVVVSPGTYTDPFTFPAYPLTLRSEAGPAATVLDGSLLAPDRFLIDVEGDTDGPRSVIGFRVENAALAARSRFDVGTGTVRFERDEFRNNGPAHCLQLDGPSSEVTDCVFEGNHSYGWGGALQVAGDAIVRGCTFRDNHADPVGPVLLTQGGAIYLPALNNRTGLRVLIEDNLFEGNTCTDYGGAINDGSLGADVEVRHNVFRSNVAGACAGGVYKAGGTAPWTLTIEDNLFIGNESPFGATLALEATSGTAIRGNTIVGSVGGAQVKLTNDTSLSMDANVIAFGADYGVRWDLSQGDVGCNLVFGHAVSDWLGPVSGTPVFEDPQFCDAAGGNYRVRQGSPCLPESGTCGILLGAFGVGCPAAPEGRLAVEPESWGAVKARYR